MDLKVVRCNLQKWVLGSSWVVVFSRDINIFVKETVCKACSNLKVCVILFIGCFKMESGVVCCKFWF